MLDVGQRRIARTEIIHGQFDSHLTQACEQIAHPLSGSQRAFRDLDLQCVRGDSEVEQGIADAVDEIFLYLCRRHIHRHTKYRHTPIPPFPHLPAGFPQYPVAQFDDQSDLFRQRDEELRADQTAQRVLPAGQCLDADDRAIARVHLRLIKQAKFSLCQGAANLAG